jgi:hypothetical protein
MSLVKRQQKSNKKKARQSSFNNIKRELKNISSERRLPYEVRPRELVLNPKYRFIRRFVATGAISSFLTIAHLFSCFITAATTVLGYSPFSAIRLVCIKFWGPPASVGTDITMNITPIQVETDLNSYGDIPFTYSDTSTDITRPCFVGFIPAKDTPSGSWHYSTTTSVQLINVQIPTACCMDLILEGIPNIVENPKGFTQTLVGATVGAVYCRPILTNFIPVGVNSI